MRNVNFYNYLSSIGDENCPQNAAIEEIQEYLPKFYNLFNQYGSQIEYYFSSSGKYSNTNQVFIFRNFQYPNFEIISKWFIFLNAGRKGAKGDPGEKGSAGSVGLPGFPGGYGPAGKPGLKGICLLINENNKTGLPYLKMIFSSVSSDN